MENDLWKKKDICLLFSTHSIRGKKVEIKVSFAFRSEFFFCPVLLHFCSQYRLSNDTTTKTLKQGVGEGMGGGLASST